jgi:hypothetical protein
MSEIPFSAMATRCFPSMFNLYRVMLLPDTDSVLRVTTLRAHTGENVRGWAYAKAQSQPNVTRNQHIEVTCASARMQAPSHTTLSNLLCTFLGHQPKRREQNDASLRKSGSCGLIAGILLAPGPPWDHDVSGCVYAKTTWMSGKASGTLSAIELYRRPICLSGSVRSSCRSSVCQPTRKSASAVTSSWHLFAALSKLSPRLYLASPYATLIPHPLRPFCKAVRM